MMNCPRRDASLVTLGINSVPVLPPGLYAPWRQNPCFAHLCTMSGPINVWHRGEPQLLSSWMNRWIRIKDGEWQAGLKEERGGMGRGGGITWDNNTPIAPKLTGNPGATTGPATALQVADGSNFQPLRKRSPSTSPRFLPNWLEGMLDQCLHCGAYYEAPYLNSPWRTRIKQWLVFLRGLQNALIIIELSPHIYQTKQVFGQYTYI